VRPEGKPQVSAFHIQMILLVIVIKPRFHRHGEDVGLIPQLSFNAPPCGRMVDRHAERLMVAYLNLELAAIFGGEVNFT
jgi:hypothetical protein